MFYETGGRTFSAATGNNVTSKMGMETVIKVEIAELQKAVDHYSITLQYLNLPGL